MPLNATTSALPRIPTALRGNVLVGLTLAVVTLPQAIAFSTTLAGLPPHFGIYAAIWGVLFTALLNPSRVFSGGPNTTMSAAIGVILLPVAPPFGADYIGYALTLILLAGLIQLLFVVIRPLGRMLDQRQQSAADRVARGLVAGGDEDQEVGEQLELGQRAAADAGVREQAHPVVARLGELENTP